jgi:Protein of unknown function (DUF1275)
VPLSKGGGYALSDALTADSIHSYSLFGITAVTGLVDAVSISLGHVFTANMIGNIVLLALASTGVPEMPLTRSPHGLETCVVLDALKL